MPRDDFFGSIRGSVERNGIHVGARILACDYCPFEEAIVDHKHMPPDALRNKFTSLGWSIPKKGKKACPKCVSKFRSRSAQTKEKTKMQKEKPREMQPADKRKIFRAIDDNYDERGLRYVGDSTDETIAKSLDMPRAWVSKVRQESFGPSGANEDMDKLMAALGRLQADARKASSDALLAAEKAEAVSVQCEEMKEKLQKIVDAVGPAAGRI